MRKLFAVALAGLTLAGAATTTANAGVQTAVKPTPALAISGEAGFQRVQYYDRRHYNRPRYNRGYRQGYRDAYRYSNPNYRYYDRRYRDNDNDEVVAAIAGGVLGYALGAYSNNGYGNNGYNYGGGYYAPPQYYQPRYCSDYYGRTYPC